jgi:hypothetical protein
MKTIHSLILLLAFAGLGLVTQQCSVGNREEIFGTGALDPTQINEVAVNAASWSRENNLDRMSYQHICAAYGILKVAKVTGNESLRKEAEMIFRQELLEGVSPHRDNATDYPPHQWFGFVPLELYRQTDDPRYLKRGLEMAEEQYVHPDENGMPAYTARMECGTS